MRNIFIIALCILSVTGFSEGQQTSPFTPAPSMNAKPEPVKVYAVGPDVTAPELLPMDFGPFSAEKCKRKINRHVEFSYADGTVLFSLLVDAEGKPHNIMFIQRRNTVLEMLAQLIVEKDRFNPGTHDGVPVVVSESVELSLKACVEGVKEGGGKKNYKLRLLSQPVQTLGTIPQPSDDNVILSTTESSPNLPVISIPGVYNVGGDVKAPVVINTVDAEFSEEARAAKYSGICYVSLIVDAHGMPQNVQVIRALGMGLDEKAMEAVHQYRFKPGMKNGVPVPVEIMVEVNFRLYGVGP